MLRLETVLSCLDSVLRSFFCHLLGPVVDLLQEVLVIAARPAKKIDSVGDLHRLKRLYNNNRPVTYLVFLSFVNVFVFSTLI